jgi:excisionase family DNA binding protein
MSMNTEVTRQEAADFLNVSLLYLDRLLEEGEIPFRPIGSDRSVLYQDLVAYHAKSKAGRKAALDALALEAQALGLGY